MTLLDWGDSTIGHPLLDLPAFLDRTPTAEGPAIRAHWEAAWRAAIPGADPRVRLGCSRPWRPPARPSSTGNSSTTIEPAERAYHAATRPIGCAEPSPSSTRSANPVGDRPSTVWHVEPRRVPPYPSPVSLSRWPHLAVPAIRAT